MVLSALLALSSAHKRRTLEPSMTFRVNAKPDKPEVFMLKHYGSALRSLQAHLADSRALTRSKLLPAIITCAIFTLLEYLRNNQRPPLLALNNIRADGSIKLTENLRFTTGFGYDFTSAAVTFPTVSFFRDLHCWQINGTWIPFGITKGYSFTIAAKSSLLQDLKLNRNRYAQYQ